MQFKVSKEADPTGTSLQGYFTTSFSKLAEALGPPLEESDGYKVSTEWDLISKDGVTVTLYDYKETSLYDSSYPSVDAFRSLPKYDWHIGAQNKAHADALIKWLEVNVGVE